MSRSEYIANAYGYSFGTPRKPQRPKPRRNFWGWVFFWLPLP